MISIKNELNLLANFISNIDNENQQNVRKYLQESEINIPNELSLNQYQIYKISINCINKKLNDINKLQEQISDNDIILDKFTQLYNKKFSEINNIVNDLVNEKLKNLITLISQLDDIPKIVDERMSEKLKGLISLTSHLDDIPKLVDERMNEKLKDLIKIISEIDDIPKIIDEKLKSMNINSVLSTINKSDEESYHLTETQLLVDQKIEKKFNDLENAFYSYFDDLTNVNNILKEKCNKLMILFEKVDELDVKMTVNYRALESKMDKSFHSSRKDYEEKIVCLIHSTDDKINNIKQDYDNKIRRMFNFIIGLIIMFSVIIIYH